MREARPRVSAAGECRARGPKCKKPPVGGFYYVVGLNYGRRSGFLAATFFLGAAFFLATFFAAFFGAAFFAAFFTAFLGAAFFAAFFTAFLGAAFFAFAIFLNLMC